MIEFNNTIFTVSCDKCGVLMATCFDWGFRDDYQIKEHRVEDMKMYCGKCNASM